MGRRHRAGRRVDRRPRRARLPAAGAAAGRSSPGSAATSTPSSPPRGGRSRRSAAGRSMSWTSPRPRLREPPPRRDRATRRRHGPGRLPARPGGPQASAVVSSGSAHGRRDCYPHADAHRRALGHPQQPRGARRGPAPTPAMSTRSGTSATSSATAREPDAVVARLDERDATGVRGNHDAAAVGGPEIDWFNPEARAAAEWTRDTIVRTTTRRGSAPCPERRVDGRRHARPRQPTRPAAGVRHRPCRPPRDNIAVQETQHGLHGHTHVPGRLDRARRIASRWSSPSHGRAIELGACRTLLNPGSVGQPRDGDPRAATSSSTASVGRVTWHRVAYDIEPRPGGDPRRRAAGRLAARLSFGL